LAGPAGTISGLYNELLQTLRPNAKLKYQHSYQHLHWPELRLNAYRRADCGVTLDNERAKAVRLYQEAGRKNILL